MGKELDLRLSLNEAAVLLDGHVTGHVPEGLAEVYDTALKRAISLGMDDNILETAKEVISLEEVAWIFGRRGNI